MQVKTVHAVPFEGTPGDAPARIDLNLLMLFLEIVNAKSISQAAALRLDSLAAAARSGKITSHHRLESHQPSTPPQVLVSTSLTDAERPTITVS